ncbi:MAG: ABC transporter ATP-binding protein [Candidatus Methanomethylicia archaeon]
MKAVEFINVTKTFKSGAMGKKTVALKNVSFQVEDGEAIAIMGPSPSGKTTLLKLTAGIYRPDEGDIIVYGRSIRRDLNWIRKNTYYVSQSMQLNKKLTIKEEISYFQEIFGNKMGKECIRMLETVGIYREDYGKRIEVLSETQITILKLILGLIKKPKILLMDNILGDLEYKILEETLEILRSINGLTMMIVDKNVDVLNNLCERIILLSNGEVIDVGNIKRILADYPYKYDIEVTWKGNIDNDKLRSMGYQYKVMGNTVRFNLKSEVEIEELIRKLLMDMKNIVKFQVSGLDIEDIYYWRLNR